MMFPPPTPEIFALLFLATIAAFIGELIARNAPPFGFVGGIILGLLGVWIFANLPWPKLQFEPTLEQIPVIKAVIGGILIVTIFSYVRKRQNT